MTVLSFSEQFREGKTSYVSPTKLGNLLGFQLKDIADRAHVHRNTIARNPRDVYKRQDDIQPMRAMAA